MPLNMHTAGKKADWNLVKPKKRNFWQKLAVSTRGVITPANIVSGVGAVLVVIGFMQFGNGVTLQGLVLIATGRIADIADGYVAHVTGTKSPLGEAIDTIIDKLTILFGLVVIIIFNLLPALFIAAIIVQSLINSIASLIGRRRGVAIHPSQYGKLATFLAWFTIISYLLYSLVDERTHATALSGTVLALSYLSFIFFVLLAIHSTASYLNQLRPKK